MVGKDIRHDFGLLKYVGVFYFVSQHMISSGECLCARLKNGCSGAGGWNVLCMSVRSIWSLVLFRSAVPLLIFCLDGLSNFPTVTELLYISPFSCAFSIQVLLCCPQLLHLPDECTPLSLYSDPLCLL